MPRVKPEERRRARVPKVRSGCKTFRRVKCDEGRPVCLRCTSTGRRCDGYESDASQPGPCLTRSIESTRSEESRGLQFFAEKTILSFQAFFPDDLWRTRALQVAQSESSIRHGLIALATYHQEYLGQEGTEMSEFALSQYNLAIKELIYPLGREFRRPDPHLQVLSCLIFISIEILRGKTESAINLFKYGCQIMWQFGRTQAYQLRPGSDAEITIHLAEAFFKRLAVQISMLVGDVSPELSITFHARSSNKVLPASYNFRTLVAARETLLNIIMNSSIQLESQIGRVQYAEQIQQWIQSFTNLVARLPADSLSDTEKRGIALLELQKQNLTLDLTGIGHDTTSLDEDFFWDQYVNDFEQMIPWAAVAVGLDKDNKGQKDPGEPLWHMEIGVTPVLFRLVARCRDPLVRRKAIALMLADRMQEGIWNSFLAARVAKILVELEENGRTVLSSEDIDATRRVRTVKVQLGPGDRQAMVQYANKYGCIEHYVEW